MNFCVNVNDKSPKKNEGEQDKNKKKRYKVSIIAVQTPS